MLLLLLLQDAIFHILVVCIHRHSIRRAQQRLCSSAIQQMAQHKTAQHGTAYQGFLVRLTIKHNGKVIGAKHNRGCRHIWCSGSLLNLSVLLIPPYPMTFLFTCCNLYKATSGLSLTHKCPPFPLTHLRGSAAGCHRPLGWGSPMLGAVKHTKQQHDTRLGELCSGDLLVGCTPYQRWTLSCRSVSHTGQSHLQPRSSSPPH